MQRFGINPFIFDLEVLDPVRAEIAAPAFVEIAVTPGKMFLEKSGVDRFEAGVDPKVFSVDRDAGKGAARRWNFSAAENFVGEILANERRILAIVVEREFETFVGVSFVSVLGRRAEV